ncbi:hypothetical protein, partial [Segatella copri]|uniref:hypothetical protein n=1 Tax=Segatella copri TaxID=165179 RepID=UPI001D16FEDB
SRLLSISEASITKVVGAFLFSCSFLSYRSAFSHSSSQLLLPFYFFTFLPFIVPFTFLPFYFFTFIYFPVKNYGESSLVMFMYKMLMNGGFSL